jgi:tetratricopeptide (TPR) repeat protein
MDNGFIDILKNLVKEQGNAALTDEKKCKAFLADYAKNEYKKECRLILIAVEAGMSKVIDGAEELTACKKAFIRDLEEEGLNSAVAADIVNALALVLRGDTTVTAPPSLERRPSAQQTAAPVATPAMQKGQSEKAEELFRKGKDAYKREDYAEAIKCWSTAADMGHVEAQIRLGFCYECSYGVRQDKAKAEYWYKKAASIPAETPEAMHQKGTALWHLKQRDEAHEWYRKAAGLGHPGATFQLGVDYSLGTGLPRDEAKAEGFFRKAADLGHAEAQSHMGRAYYEGKSGYPQNKTEAAKWLRKAADQGDESAQYYLNKLKSEGTI